MEPGSISRLGDGGIVLEFDRRPSRKLTEYLAGLSEAARRLDGVVDAVPGHRTLLIETDRTSDDLANEVRTLMTETKVTKGTVQEVPIVYDGPDIDWVCRHLEIGREELALQHLKKTYDVRMLGSPMFVYLSSVAREITVPRLEDPRVEVPAGSVGIGGRQTGIYGKARPGGWRIIGTVAQVPDVTAGDRIKFIPQ